MSKNFEAYLKLDDEKYLGKYIVMVDQKVVASGKDIVSLLKDTRRKFPRKTPFVAKIPEKSVLVL
jgi:hypothetical protein